jgi:uncharacterized membrane protein
MKKRLIFLIFVMLLIPIIYAQTEITFISPDNEDFSNYYLTLNFDDALHKEFLTTSKTIIKFPSAEESVIINLDNLKTPNNDYYGVEKIDTTKDSLNILVFPVGYIQGSVVDKTGNLVPNAKLSFTCHSPIAINFPEKTDSTGFFHINNMPVGECLIIASAGESVGKTTAKINKGEVSEIEIVLMQEVSKSSFVFVTFLLLLIGVLIVGGIIFLIFRYNLTKKKVVKKEEIKLKEKDIPLEKEKYSKKTLVLLETFSDKERKIVQFLLDSDNHSSQSKIRHATKIPRTSLSRTLKGLERKKIILIEKHGKMASISLTPFFLG